MSKLKICEYHSSNLIIDSTQHKLYYPYNSPSIYKTQRKRTEGGGGGVLADIEFLFHISHITNIFPMAYSSQFGFWILPNKRYIETLAIHIPDSIESILKHVYKPNRTGPQVVQ